MIRSLSLGLSSIAIIVAIAALVLSAVAVSGGAGRSGTAAGSSISKLHEPGSYTKSFVSQAVERYDDEGRGETIAYYNTKGSMDGDWYVFIIDESAGVVSHAARPERLGLKFEDMVDVSGYNYGADFAAATEDGAWVTYTYLNPANGFYEKKHSWVVERDGLIFGSGWYERSAPSLLPSKSDQPAFTKAFVERALRFYQSQGRDAAFARYNSMASVDGDWYLFVLEDDKIIVHPTIAELIGEDIKGPAGTDSSGYKFGLDMLSTTEAGKWVDYTYLNPANGREEKKHAWVVLHDGLIFGSGWYER